LGTKDIKCRCQVGILEVEVGSKVSMKEGFTLERQKDKFDERSG
jgi:hypothetical protein